MLNDHKELLALVGKAEAKAREIYASGARVDLIVNGLRNAGRAVKERIAHYERDAAKEKAAKSEAGLASGKQKAGEATV